jgi:hypothetical protein
MMARIEELADAGAIERGRRTNRNGLAVIEYSMADPAAVYPARTLPFLDRLFRRATACMGVSLEKPYFVYKGARILCESLDFGRD